MEVEITIKQISRKSKTLNEIPIKIIYYKIKMLILVRFC